MISSSIDKDFEAKQEGGTGTGDEGKVSKAPATSRQWSSAFRNPRIVRVSRSFGGKDRHSKVCTIRGLRDRRIRLSVPTAIQLYDLQDRLGLNQPSKVIDWLLDATKCDIDKLPPLQMPQVLGQFHQPMLVSRESNAAQSSLSPLLLDANSSFGFHCLGIRINNGFDGQEQNTVAKTRYCREVEASIRGKSKEVETCGKGKSMKTNERENQYGVDNLSGQVSVQNLVPLPCNPSLPGLLNNPMPMPFNDYHHWDVSNLSLSRFEGQGFLYDAENSVSNPSALALSSGSQFLFSPPATMPSLYPPSLPTPVQSQSREMNHFQLLSSSSTILPISRTMCSPTKTFSLNVNPGLLHLQGSDEGKCDEDNTDS